ncbi:MAG: right-handed parallel beta-helix repeat-containing protein [Bacteroidetes bacterium]|nr:right-handed parallel beta-helix repeat-containing protein [Bacteroidota bacterium]
MSRHFMIAILLITSSVSSLFSQTGYTGSIGTVRDLPNDWWGLNAHDITHDDFELGADVSNPALHSIIDNWKKTKTGTLRYPGDGDVNDWDWLTGYYLTHGLYPPVHGQFDLDLHANTYFDLRRVTNTMGAKITFALNPLSSNINYQLAGLKLAQSLRFDINRIELGEELFGKSPLNQNSFETAAEYGTLCSDWIDELHSANNFPLAKIAVVGAATAGDVRKIGWNVDLLTSPALENKNIDAVTIHFYPDSGLEPGGTVTTDEMPTLFDNCYDEAECLEADIAQIQKIKPATEIWITEYNLAEKSKVIHGSWAHALFTTLQTMLMMQEENITHATLQNASSDGVRGLLFERLDGLDKKAYGNFPAPHDCSGCTTNVQWDYTALGNSMRLFATAIRGMTNAAPVDFVAAPYFGDDPNHKKIYAWIFADNSDVANATTRNAIILNLDEIEQYVDLSVFNVTDGQFEQLFNYGPAVFAGGSAVYGAIPADPVFIQGFPTIHTTKNNLLSSQKISSNNPTNFKLYPFSITYLHFSVNAPAVTPASATICSGSSVTLKATGGCSYEWTVSPGNYTLDESIGNIISVHPETTGTYTFTVTVKNKNGNPVPGSPQTANVTVVATPTPFTVSTAADGCDVVLSAPQSADSYTWFPADGLSATTGQTVTVDFSAEPRTYIVTASNGSCKYSQPITASQIINTGNQLAIEHLNRAYVGNCNNQLYFHNDGNDQTAIFGVPIGGYFEIEKWDVNGNMVGTDEIDASELNSGIYISCDVVGKYILRYKYASPGCVSENILEQTTFILGVEATATLTKVCPDFSLPISPADKNSWDAFYWEPANSYLYDQNGTQIQSGVSYDQVYFKSSTPGAYIVTIKGLDGNTECSHFDYEVTVSDKCSCTSADNNYRFVDISYSQLLDFLYKDAIQCNTTYKGSTLDNNGVLYFFGTFTIDQEASLLNTLATPLELVFGTDANVLISNYRTFTCDEVHAHACSNDAWRGIEVFGTQSELAVTNSKIEEAYRAVHAKENTTIRLTGSAFEDNYASVYFNASGIGTDFSSSIIHSCSFKTVDGLKNYTGQSQLGDMAKYGISLLNIGQITLGSDVPGEENIFDNLRCGINGSRSSFDVTRCSFTNMIRPATFTNSDGCGIFESVTTTNSTLTVNVSGMGPYAAVPNFQNCVNGIWLKGVRSDGISDNYMKDVTNGILFTACNNASMLSVTYNKIENTNLGISVSTSNSATVNILFNDITSNVGQPPAIPPPPVVTAISIADNSQALSCHATVSSNTLNLKGHYGIYVSNNSSAIISNNTINHNTGLNVSSFAFRLDNCNLPQISCNTVTGIGNVNSLINHKKSFSFSMTKNARIEHNASSENRIAFEFLSDCNPTAILDNTINNHYYGMYLGNSTTTAVIGNQTAQDYGNGTAETPGNDFVGTGSGSFPGFALDGNDNSPQTFYESNSSVESFYPLPNEIAFPFVGNNVTASLYQSDLMCGQQSAAVMIISTDDAAEIADDNTVEPDPVEDLIIWSQKKGVYSEMADDSSFAFSNETLETFYDTTAVNNTGKLVDAEKNLELLQDSSISETVKQGALNDAQSKVDDIISDKIYESNKQQIYNLIIANLKEGSDSLSYDEKALVQTIADQCPFVGGPAVYEARAIRASYTDSIYYDDDAICSQSQRLQSTDKNEIVQSLILFPNPAEQSCYLQFESEYGVHYHFGVTDLVGKELYSRELYDDQIYPVPTNLLSAGVYTWRCIAETGTWELSGKLVIVK